MAEETILLPVSPNVNRSWRKISTRKLSFLYTEEKIIPNYLGSTGSCHDVCKYGRKHEPQDKPNTVSPLKRVSRNFYETLISFNSPLRKKKKKKALTKSVLNPSSFGSGKRKKTASHSFKTIGVSRRRELEIVEHNKRLITALKLKSVAQKAAMALRLSTINRKKTNGDTEPKEPKKSVVSLRDTMSSKRCSKSLKPNKESNVTLLDETCKDLVEEKTLYVNKVGTENETDQNKRCVMDSSTDDPKSEKSQEEAECVVTEADEESSPQEEEDENTTRQGKSKALSTESTTINSKSTRLRFKRGKFVDVRSQDNNSPRKLTFKRGKIITRADTATQSGGGRRRPKTRETIIRAATRNKNREKGRSKWS